METIILTVDNKINAKKIFDALPLLKGVKNVSIVHGVNKRINIMDEIELSFNQVKMIQKGELPNRSLKQILSDNQNNTYSSI